MEIEEFGREDGGGLVHSGTTAWRMRSRCLASGMRLATEHPTVRRLPSDVGIGIGWSRLPMCSAQQLNLQVHRLNEFRGHQNRYGHLCFHRRDTYGHCVSMFLFNQHLEHFL